MAKSCLNSARIYLTVDYRSIKLVFAIYPFQVISLDTRCITYGIDNKFYFVVALDHLTLWIGV